MNMEKNKEAQAMAKLRWSRVSKEDRKAHAIKMNDKKWAKKRAEQGIKKDE
jgi:hypothetical protein